ncbi:MAG: CPBP family intramembrane metalloprotease [Thaumarchaeota archaeon]|nr:CPBP family intramembrane metalloprotease [Nitrososphaerota archaeon]
MSYERYYVVLDAIGLGTVVLSLSILFLEGLGASSVMLTAVYINLLTVAGLVLGVGTGGLRWAVSGVNHTQAMKELVYYLYAFGAIALMNLFVKAIPPNLAISPNVGRVIAVEISSAEEVWFRGFFGTYLANQYRRAGLVGGMLAQAIVFATYHLFVYGDDPSALLIVAGAGFIMGYADIKAKSLTPSLLAHLTNNLFASGVI